MTLKLSILVGTMTGTAQLVAQELELAWDGDGIAVETLLMDDLDASVFARGGVFLICTSTYGQGDVPDNAKMLNEEIFGPSSLVVWCGDRAEMLAVARHLEGNLTATLQAGAAEAGAQGELIAILETKAGRLLLNGFPTGVEVSHAMVHGGPYPATSDGGRSTSVGTRALNRWARAVCYQNFSEELLPPELRDANPSGLLRMVNGEWTRAAVGG